MNKLKRVLVSFCLVVVTSGLAFAGNIPQPTIEYANGIRVFGDQRLNLIEEEAIHAVGGYDRMLGLKKQDIIQRAKDHVGDTFDISTKDISKQIYFLILEDNKEPILGVGKAIYILNKENVSIGYCLLDPMVSDFKDNLFVTDSVVRQITSLQVNNNLLKNKKFYPNTSAIVYEKEHDGYIERYILGKTQHSEMLLLDAFYPKEFDSVLKEKITKNIRLNLKLKQKVMTGKAYIKDNDNFDDDNDSDKDGQNNKN